MIKALPNATNRPEYLALWAQYRTHKAHCARLLETTAEKECETAHNGLFALEHFFKATVSQSIDALGATLIIEAEARSPEEVDGLNKASLAAIRHQLVGQIAEDADRVLAEEEDEEASQGAQPEAPVAPDLSDDGSIINLQEIVRRFGEIEGAKCDPILSAMKTHCRAWRRYVEQDHTEPRDPVAWSSASKALDLALQELLDCAPTTLAGIHAAIAYFVTMDRENVPETSGAYMRTLLSSPVFIGAAARPRGSDADREILDGEPA